MGPWVPTQTFLLFLPATRVSLRGDKHQVGGCSSSGRGEVTSDAKLAFWGSWVFIPHLVEKVSFL